MRDEPGSSRFRELFESALRDYEKTTNLTLAKHPLAEPLQNCHSVESITAFLQDKAREFGDFEGRNEMMKSIKSTVSILCALSTTAALGDAVYLVCPRRRCGYSTSDSSSVVNSTCKSNIYCHRRPTDCMYSHFVPMCAPFSHPSASGGQGDE